MEYKLDTEFIGKPHEWDPRRLYSQSGADWQYRVDFERLRKERLHKTREQMEVNILGAPCQIQVRTFTSPHSSCTFWIPANPGSESGAGTGLRFLENTLPYL